MNIDEYLSVVEKSRPEDWRVAQVPTFMYRVVPVRGGGGADFEIQEHNATMNYSPDIRFSLAWGLVSDRNYTADWIDKLPNKKAEAVVLDFLYNGALVLRDTLVAVDGWRCILPQPINSEGPQFDVPIRKYRISKLVHRLVGPETNFDSYFKRVGLRPSKDPWP